MLALPLTTAMILGKLADVELSFLLSEMGINTICHAGLPYPCLEPMLNKWRSMYKLRLGDKAVLPYSAEETW